jgi:LuxR family maltose regulon positive regulatory protein
VREAAQGEGAPSRLGLGGAHLAPSPPNLGTLVSEAGALRSRPAKDCGSTAPGASALTMAELRLLPMLCTHLTVPEIAAETFLLPHTITSRR